MCRPLRWGGTPLRDALREGHSAVGLYLHKKGGKLGMDEITSSGSASMYTECLDAPSLSRCSIKHTALPAVWPSPSQRRSVGAHLCGQQPRSLSLGSRAVTLQPIHAGFLLRSRRTLRTGAPGQLGAAEDAGVVRLSDQLGRLRRSHVYAHPPAFLRASLALAPCLTSAASGRLALGGQHGQPQRRQLHD